MDVISLVHLLSKVDLDLVSAKLALGHLLAGAALSQILRGSHQPGAIAVQSSLSEELIGVRLVNSIQFRLQHDSLREDLSLSLRR